jgi:hypothetical protein
MRSNMTHSFSMVPKADIPRSVFNCPQTYKTAFNAGDLIPFYVDEVVPGDTFTIKAQMFGRLATPLHPIMDNLWLETFYFAVPNRLVWENWAAFMGEQDDPMDPVEYIVPEVDSGTGWAVNSIFDYMGLPVNVGDIQANSLHMRAYNLIFNEWFRDENLIDKVTVPTGDSDSSSNYSILKRGKRHDYFTSCLPWPQKGPSVNIPIGGEAPVTGDGSALGLTDFYTPTPYSYALKGVGAGFDASSQGFNQDLPYLDTNVSADAPRTNYVMGVSTNADHSGLIADLSSASIYTVNELRQAMQLQKMLERDARGGTRYTEIIRSHFGVVSPDMRMQRPEYLGGSSSRINMYPVQQTSETSANGALGSLAAFGIGNDQSGFNKSFTEHCVIIGLVNIRADINYQQGIHRMWSRHTKYDFLWPALSHIGEQAVLNKEIYAQGDDVMDTNGEPYDENVFGYQERYAEYRYGSSKVTGIMRSGVTGSLEAWHLAEHYGSLPTLGETFITDQTEAILDRCIAVPSEPQFILDVFMEAKKARPLPVFGVPGLMDHF